MAGVPGEDSLPFLEEALTVPLGRLAEAARKDPKKRVARTRRGPGLDFEALYDRLLRYRQVHGHCNVPQKYGEDGQLGSWVANIRSKRKQMAKRGEEFELDVPAGEDDEDENEAMDDLGGLGDGTEGGKRRRHRGGRQRLTRERIVSVCLGRELLVETACPSAHVHSLLTHHSIFSRL